MKTFYSPKTYILSFLFYTLLSFSSFAQVGIGTTTPDDDLDVIGNTQVSGYMRVGDPATPQATTSNGVQLLYTSGSSDFFQGWTQAGCGNNWVTGYNDAADGYMLYIEQGIRGNVKLTSPHIWIPSNTSSITVEINHGYDFVTGYDGVYLEYSIDNGTTWNSTDSDFTSNGYPGIVDGSDDTCSSDANINAWSGATPAYEISVMELTITNTWIQFRLSGMEDDFWDLGYYFLWSFNVIANTSGTNTGGSFTAGNLYAENNVYAGSNVLLGDLAEYFPVQGLVEKGDLISYLNVKNDIYTISTKENDQNIIGIYSSNPTLTLNNPSNGTPVALQGRVPVNVVGEPINKGDYIMASKTPGKGKKATESGFVVGRALEGFEGGKGQIICLVETGWKNLNTTQKQLSSSDIFPKGTKKVLINNHAISKDSKIFVTFQGNIGSRHWIENIKDGSFELNIENQALNNVNFDYLVENAITLVSNNINLNRVSNSNKNNDLKAERGENRSITIELPTNTTLVPNGDNSGSPPSVPNLEMSYVWTQESGLIEGSKSNKN